MNDNRIDNMNFNQFIGTVEEQVESRIKAETGLEGEVTICVHTQIRNNGVEKRGLTISEKGINISPTIYLEEYFEQYQIGRGLNEIVNDILRLYKELRFRDSWKGEFLWRYLEIQDKIIYRLVNREANRELLKEVPYKEYLDLAVVFYVALEIREDGMASMMIKNEHLQAWGVTAEEVYGRACQNTCRLLPCEFRSMHRLIEMLTGEEDLNGEDILYVLSNQFTQHGAAAILYEGQLEEIGRLLRENYYVLPSSINETIILPESNSPGMKELSALVKEVNETQVSKEEVLADHAYYYDRGLGQLVF